MLRISHHRALHRIAMLASLTAATILTAPVMADQSSPAPAANAQTGLGQSWPNAPDVSANPNWHVYVFHRDGIRYIQVNDLNGHVRGAFAAANGEFLALPIGSDAQRLVIPSPSSGTADAMASTGTAADDETTVYQDDSMQVLAAPQSNGTMELYVHKKCTNPYQCSGRIQ